MESQGHGAHGSFNAETDFGLMLNGVLDVLFALAMTLERKELMSRSELAAMLRFVESQATAAQGGRTKRTLIAEIMIEAFEMPIAGDQVRAGWQVIDGGKTDT